MAPFCAPDVPIALEVDRYVVGSTEAEEGCVELHQGLRGVLMQPVHEMASMEGWYSKCPSPGVWSYFIASIGLRALIALTVRIR